MDYHNIGFRECAAEVARYLVTVEGLDIQDPLRLRLMSHLQCFSAQRELAAKQSPWYPGSSGTPTHQPYKYVHVSIDIRCRSGTVESCRVNNYCRADMRYTSPLVTTNMRRRP